MTNTAPVSSSDRLLAFYTATAAEYDIEAEPQAEHRTALRLITAVLRDSGARRVLDVGCGTGRAMRAISAALPNVEVTGLDPSPDLLTVARDRHGIPAERLVEGSGTAMPFPDGAFDAAVVMAVLHHVPDPRAVIAEMLRVSQGPVMLSDANRFGQGRVPVRAVKLALRLSRLDRIVDRVRHGDEGSYTSDGDGVAWPFSLYDVLPQLEAACTEVLVVPTKGTLGMHAVPIGAASHLVVIGYRDGP